jgi:hypothetical protein
MPTRDVEVSNADGHDHQQRHEHRRSDERPLVQIDSTIAAAE